MDDQEFLKRLELFKRWPVQPAGDDYNARQEEGYYEELKKRQEIENTQQEIELKKIEVANAENTLQQRGWLLIGLLLFGLCWISGVFILLLLQGFGLWKFHLEGVILQTLLITNTAQVVGLVVIITKYYFK